MHQAHLLSLLTLLCIMSGCATRLSQQAQSIQTADERMVSSCTFVAEVQGSSGWGNLAASKGMQNARNEAQEVAAGKGATHIVWVSVAGGFSPFAVGRAYRCP